ncbi:PREDICTED: uncharacterized protein LOC108694549 [Atta colombica]|uniref:uncharacterized protein LOC108694549 n=1 Tax=Atta colombica TaxID=520822 RepID=UPI00084CCDC5|nr:PREDICTED: uncharacterized protein LOC108694549 [Atta colombica]
MKQVVDGIHRGSSTSGVSVKLPSVRNVSNHSQSGKSSYSSIRILLQLKRVLQREKARDDFCLKTSLSRGVTPDILEILHSVSVQENSMDEQPYGEAEEIYRKYQQQNDQYKGILVDILKR